MISALPSSLHSHTLALICSRTSDLISPVSPENRARKPCVRLLMTSISWRLTVWTTSFLFCSSPSGHCTNCVCRGKIQTWLLQKPNVFMWMQIFFLNNAALISNWWTGSGYLSSHGIIVSGSGEGPSQLTDLSCGFIDGNNISEERSTERQCPLGMAVQQTGVVPIHKEGWIKHWLTLLEPSLYWDSRSSCCPNHISSPSQSSSVSTCPPWRPDRHSRRCVSLLFIIAESQVVYWQAYRPSGWSINLDFHHLSFYYFCLLPVKETQ